MKNFKLGETNGLIFIFLHFLEFRTIFLLDLKMRTICVLENLVHICFLFIFAK